MQIKLLAYGLGATVRLSNCFELQTGKQFWMNLDKHEANIFRRCVEKSRLTTAKATKEKQNSPSTSMQAKYGMNIFNSGFRPAWVGVSDGRGKYLDSFVLLPAEVKLISYSVVEKFSSIDENLRHFSIHYCDMLLLESARKRFAFNYVFLSFTFYIIMF